MKEIRKIAKELKVGKITSVIQALKVITDNDKVEQIPKGATYVVVDQNDDMYFYNDKELIEYANDLEEGPYGD